MGWRVEEEGGSECRPVIRRIRVEPSGEITLRESGLTSLATFPAAASARNHPPFSPLVSPSQGPTCSQPSRRWTRGPRTRPPLGSSARRYN